MSWLIPYPDLALKLRRLRGRFGISAPQVAVRTHIPWYLRALGVAGMVALTVILVDWAYDAGQRLAGFERSETKHLLDNFRSRNSALDEEVTRLRTQLAAAESSLQIEQAAQKLLAEKNSVLANENSRLKEDISVFERLARLEKKHGSGVSLEKLKVERDGAPGGYRYSLLISLQGDRRGKDSRFKVVITAIPKSSVAEDRKDDGQQRGRMGVHVAQDDIEMRSFRRIEGRFVLPLQASFAKVEFNILEAGVVKATQSFSL